MGTTFRRVPGPGSTALYEVQVPGATLRLRPSELCAFAEALERWFAGHRAQLVDDLVDESLGRAHAVRRHAGLTTSAMTN